MTQATFFESPAELRAWFTENHETASELWLGIHKVGSGRPGITLAQAVEEAEATFRAHPSAWDWFRQSAPSYQRSVIHWVISAKKPETQARRLATLITHSAAGRRIGPFVPGKPKART